jgi:hypothetical protein
VGTAVALLLLHSPLLPLLCPTERVKDTPATGLAALPWPGGCPDTYGSGAGEVSYQSAAYSQPLLYRYARYRGRSAPWTLRGTAGRLALAMFMRDAGAKTR